MRVPVALQLHPVRQVQGMIRRAPRLVGQGRGMIRRAPRRVRQTPRFVRRAPHLVGQARGMIRHAPRLVRHAPAMIRRGPRIVRQLRGPGALHLASCPTRPTSCRTSPRHDPTSSTFRRTSRRHDPTSPRRDPASPASRRTSPRRDPTSPHVSSDNHKGMIGEALRLVSLAPCMILAKVGAALRPKRDAVTWLPTCGPLPKTAAIRLRLTAIGLRSLRSA